MDELTHTIMSEALVARGVLSPEAVAADRLEQFGADVPPVTIQAPKPDPFKTPAPQGVMAQPQAPQAPDAVDPLWSAPSSPGAYTFERPQPTFNLKTEEGKAEFAAHLAQEQAFREWLHSEAVPAGLAKEFDRRAHANVAKNLTPEQVVITQQQGLVELGRKWGDDLKPNLDLARAEIDRMAEKQPNLWDVLRQTNLVNDTSFIQTLVNRAKSRGLA